VTTSTSAGDFTRQSLAAFLSCSLAAVDDLIRSGRVEAYKLGTGPRAGVRVTRESVERLRAGRPMEVLRTADLKGARP